MSVAKNLDNRGMEILDFGPFGRRPLVHFAQDDKRENVILSVAKNLNNSGIENLDFGPFGRRPLVHIAQDDNSRMSF